MRCRETKNPTGCSRPCDTSSTDLGAVLAHNNHRKQPSLGGPQGKPLPRWRVPLTPEPRRHPCEAVTRKDVHGSLGSLHSPEPCSDAAGHMRTVERAHIGRVDRVKQVSRTKDTIGTQPQRGVAHGRQASLINVKVAHASQLMIRDPVSGRDHEVTGNGRDVLTASNCHPCDACATVNRHDVGVAHHGHPICRSAGP